MMGLPSLSRTAKSGTCQRYRVNEDKFWNEVYAVAQKAGRAYLATVDRGMPRVSVVFPGLEGVSFGSRASRIR